MELMVPVPCCSRVHVRRPRHSSASSGMIKDEVSSDVLLAKLGITDLKEVLRDRRLRWHGHVERSESCINSVRKIEVDGSKGRGRPKKTWDEVVKNDMEARGLTAVDPGDRSAWRARLRQRHPGPTPRAGLIPPRDNK